MNKREDTANILAQYCDDLYKKKFDKLDNITIE